MEGTHEQTRQREERKRVLVIRKRTMNPTKVERVVSLMLTG
jgi:hypothetical protein